MSRSRRRRKSRAKIGSFKPPAKPSETVPCLVLSPPDDPVLGVLQQAALLLVKHPVAAQAAFAALVAEGRRFAQTPEGRRWKCALADSDLVRRGHALWEGSMLKTLEERGDTPLPTAILEAIIQAASRTDVTTLLQRVLPS